VAAFRVVPGLDPFEDRLPQFVSALPSLLVEEFALHRRPERLHKAVVNAGRDPAHRSEQPCLTEPVPEHPRGVLGSAVRMHHRARLGFASPPRHIKRVDDELRPDVIGDRPPDHAAGEHVHDGRAIDLPGPRRMFRDVRDPELVRAVRDELAFHEILVRGRQRAILPAFAAVADPRDPGPAHQPGHPLLSASDLQPEPQLRVHAPRAVAGSRFSVNADDRDRQLLVDACSLRGKATLPRIEPRPRDPQDPAGKGRVDPGGHEVLDHREDPFGPTTSRAKYADACRRISISAA